MSHHRAEHAEGRCAGIVFDKGNSARTRNHIGKKLSRSFVLRRKGNIPAADLRDEEGIPIIAIGMAEQSEMSIQIQTGPLADFPPDIIRSDRFARKNRATGVGFRLKTEHAPDVSPLRIGQIPAQHFRDIIDVATRDSETERVFERTTGPLADAPRQIGECLPHRMKIGLRFYFVNRKPVTTSLRHVDVDRDLAQAAFNHQPLEELRVFEQGLPVGHQHRNCAN